jgi:hypothetical protein
VFIGLVSILAAGATAAADQATAPAPAAPPPVQDYQLIWPNQGVMERFRPDYKNEMRAYISCVATPDQKLGDCKVTKTTPKSDKIGAAGLRVAANIRLKRPDGWTPGPQPEPIDVIIHWSVHN